MNDHHRHNGGPLSDDDARKLFDHVRACEILDEQMEEVREDRKARKALAKADGFDPNILEAIVKRRKLGQGETRVADSLIRLYEEALIEQGALPLEDSRRVEPPVRSSVEDISQRLHSQEPPEHVRRIEPAHIRMHADTQAAVNEQRSTAINQLKPATNTEAFEAGDDDTPF
jgi:uncharacterized protein (UPF0335 family)